MSSRPVLRALGALWLADAALQAQPVMFGSDWWRNDLAGASMGQPGPVAHLILWSTGTAALHPVMWNAMFVAVQALIGLALVTGRFQKAAIALSVPWALAVWVGGEGLGMLPTGFAMLAFGAPGAVLLYPLIGVLAGPGRDRARWGATAWVGLWAGSSLLQIPFRFPAGQVLAANFEDGPQWLTWMHGLAASHPGLLSAGLATVQVAVGVGYLWRPRPALVAGAAVSVFYWACFQGLGGLLQGGATDPGTAPLMVLLAVTLWPAADRPATGDQGATRSAVRWTRELPALPVA